MIPPGVHSHPRLLQIAHVLLTHELLLPLNRAGLTAARRQLQRLNHLLRTHCQLISQRFLSILTQAIRPRHSLDLDHKVQPRLVAELITGPGIVHFIIFNHTTAVAAVASSRLGVAAAIEVESSGFVLPEACVEV